MDAALPTGRYPGHTTAELKLKVLRHEEGRVTQPAPMMRVIKAEIARREAVAAGDVAKMTPGERLRHVGKPTLDSALQMRVAGEFTPEMLRLIRKLAGMHSEVRGDDAEARLSAAIETMIEGE